MDLFVVRKYFIRGFIYFTALVFVFRLFKLQVIDSSYKSFAESNTRRYVTQYPARGLIYDRNGKLMVYNEAAYDLMITPYLVHSFDTSQFISLLDISKEELVNRITAARKYSYYKSSILVKQLSSENYARLQEQLYKFPGFYVQTRTLREYGKKIAAHILGYVGEVDDKTVQEEEYYAMGDYIGISGIEKSYEEVLRGEKGLKIYLVDVHNRIKDSYQKGKLDKAPVVGSNITISIDAELQEYGELLMQKKRGSIVAIEPATGEILCLVSAPSYSPDLLVGRERTQNYELLKRDTLKPLFNRALMAKYPPGSTFKIVNALIGLQENIITENTSYYTRGPYRSGNVTVNCHNYRSPLNVEGAIQYSSNHFFCRLFRNIMDNGEYPSIHESFDIWRNYVLSFGFDQGLNTDFTNELNGFIPYSSYYDRYYGPRGWGSLTIISLAIGQGEISTTPIQLANMAATISNRGFYYTPHIVKEIEGKEIDEKFKVKHETTIDSSNFEIVIKGMENVVNGGPGSTGRIARISDITICGKTGTAENPHGEDHSIFIAFAPKDNPRIALSVYVENGGFGATWAAPIASLMIEKYLKENNTKRKWIENRILNADLLSDEKKD